MRARWMPFVVAAVVVAGSGTAYAKGPNGGEITGDGLRAPIPLTRGEGDPAGDRLIEDAGFFALAFSQVPDPTESSWPPGELGPKLTITWTLSAGPGSNIVREDVYPYAENGPVTFMAPGQAVYDQPVQGGWYRAAPSLVTSLQTLGVPTQPVLEQRIRAAHAPPEPARAPMDRDRGVPWLAIGGSLVLVLALALLAAVTLIVRRRHSMVPSTT
jgi:hypothetical protein